MGLCIELEGNPDMDKIGICPLHSSHAATTEREDSDEVIRVFIIGTQMSQYLC